MHPPINQETKKAILEAIKNGAKVVDIAKEYHMSDKTIYTWLRAQTDNTGTSNLEIAKLRRENQELKEIVGIFTLEKKRAEKNTYHS